jgi:hypothetical protein
LHTREEKAIGELFRNAPGLSMDAPVPLEAVITTAELNQRPSRPVDHAAVNSALVTLMQEMVNSPGTILQRLADTALDLCQAHSAGISLLEDEDGTPRICGVQPRENSVLAAQSWTGIPRS